VIICRAASRSYRSTNQKEAKNAPRHNEARFAAEERLEARQKMQDIEGAERVTEQLSEALQSPLLFGGRAPSLFAVSG
jgi:hypothetical protein